MKLERVKPFPTEDGALLYYFDVGEGRPIVVLAGAQTSVQTYRYVVKKLKNKYRVIGLERRFEGETKARLEELTMQKQGKDLDEFIQFMQLDHPILIGHSLGASVIMSYLDQFGDQDITGAIFVDQTPKMLNDATWNEGFAGRSVASLTKHTKRLTTPVRRIPELKVLWLLLNTMIIRQVSLFSVKEKLPLFEDYVKGDWRESLQKMKKPALFVGVEHSPHWPGEFAATCADLVENGTSCMMKKVGHGAHLEDPNQFARIVEDWVNQLDK